MSESRQLTTNPASPLPDGGQEDMKGQIAQATTALKQAEQARIAKEHDPARQQIIHLLYAREQMALKNHVALIQSEMPQTKKTLNFHHLLWPLATLLLSGVALALWLTLPETVTPENSGWMGRYVLCAAVQIAAVIVGVGSVIQALKPQQATVQPHLTLDEAAMNRQLLETESRIAMDAQTIEGLYAQETASISNSYEETVAELYCTLREMQVDAQMDGNHEQLDMLSWPLVNAKKLLKTMGCDVVEYSPETAVMFDLIHSDVTQQRRPAIVQKDTGLIRLRGLYLHAD